MKKGIMIGEIPLFIGENGETSEVVVTPPARVPTEQGHTNASDSNLVILGNNGNNGIVENGEAAEISSAGQDESESSSSRKRKRPYRHTKHQIDVLEDYFNVCPHPDVTQRTDLSKQLGLEPIQVKFWFQNKRTQIKSRHELKQNKQLRVENDMLRSENTNCKEVLSNTKCNICGDTATVRTISIGTHNLRLENKRLTEQIEHMKRITSEYVGKEYVESVLNPNPNPKPKGVSQNAATNTDLLAGKTVSGQYLKSITEFVEVNGPLIKELAVASMGELIKKIETREPIWIPNSDGRGYFMNMDEYFKVFPKGFHSSPTGWRSEASMESAVVMLTPFSVVDIFMDMGKWLAVYSSFVSKATSFHKFSTESEGNLDGDVQLIYTEFQTPCPIIPTRECIFLRYCKQLAVQTWAILDVSLDSILHCSAAVPSSKCLRWPSGCIIQQVLNGLSKVTWVEHAVLDDDQEVNPLAEAVIQSGVAYGARRWVSILERQTERLANAITQTSHRYFNEYVPGRIDERKGILKLTERMLLRFYGGATASNAYGWEYVSGDGVDEVKIMKWNNADEPVGHNSGIAVSASLCQWLPLPPTFVFDFIRNEVNRREWDVLCNGEFAQETIHIDSGNGNGNCVSVLQIQGNEEQGRMMIIQDSSTDQVVSTLVYAPVELESMISLICDTSSKKLGMLPCGFTVLPSPLPMRIRGNYEAFSVGSLITTSFQVLASPQIGPAGLSDSHSIEMVKSIVQNATYDIKKALLERIG